MAPSCLWTLNVQRKCTFPESLRSQNYLLKASAEETRQIIEGKLLEIGREPHNKLGQIEARDEDSEFILSSDIDGVFLEIEPPTKELVEDDTQDLYLVERSPLSLILFVRPWLRPKSEMYILGNESRLLQETIRVSGGGGGEDKSIPWAQTVINATVLHWYIEAWGLNKRAQHGPQQSA